MTTFNSLPGKLKNRIPASMRRRARRWRNLHWAGDDCILWRPGSGWSLRHELAGQATVTGAKADDTVPTVITKSGGQIASGVAAA